MVKKIHKTEGFTLIEILIVITIIGILTTIGFNISLKNIRRKNLEKVVSEIKIGIRKAKDDAYNGKIYSSGCVTYEGKTLTISSSGYMITDNCGSGTEGEEVYEFGFTDISLCNSTPCPDLVFPYLTSGVYPSAVIRVDSGNMTETIEVESGQIVEE